MVEPRLLIPLPDISILLEAFHHPQFPFISHMNDEWIVKRFNRNMFGELNEVDKPKPQFPKIQ